MVSSKKPGCFGEIVGVDTKELTDAAGTRCYALNVTDHATKFSRLILLGGQSSKEAAQAFVEGGASWAGVPKTTLAYQGPEFLKYLFGLLWRSWNTC